MKNDAALKLKILVTGGAGFIGSNIVDAYIAAGHSVVVIDNLCSGKRENVNRRARFYLADIRDKNKIAAIFRRERPCIVNHHAAQIDVRRSVEAPGFDAEVNILGTINVLSAAKDVGAKKIIFSSSGGVMYGECSPEKPPSENIPPGPLSPYGLSKFCGEQYIKYFARNYDLAYVILRYGNVYGPRQDPHGEAGVVAIFIGRMLKNDVVNIYGNGRQLRDYVYVGDVVRANLLALEKGKNEIINIGSGVTHSVLDIFSYLSDIIGYSKKPIFCQPRSGELFCSALDISKSYRTLGFSPRTGFADGLKETVKYFRRKVRE